jgi:hypothetical protein
MTKHFYSGVFTVAIIALFSMPIATAMAKQQCSEAARAHGYWSWRMIDGRKCWYEGKPMLSKSSLAWSAPSAVKPEPEEVASAVTEKPGNPMDAQARVIDTDSLPRAIGSETFDALWRARVGH